MEVIGNKVYVTHHNRFTKQNELKLIGELHKNGNEVSLYKHEKESNRFKKTDSWGVNYQLFQMLTGSINIKTEIGTYRIPMSEAKIYRKVLHFKNQGYETQCFIPVSKFKFEPI